MFQGKSAQSGWKWAGPDEQNVCPCHCLLDCWTVSRAKGRRRWSCESKCSLSLFSRSRIQSTGKKPSEACGNNYAPPIHATSLNESLLFGEHLEIEGKNRRLSQLNNKLVEVLNPIFLKIMQFLEMEAPQNTKVKRIFGPLPEPVG